MQLDPIQTDHDSPSAGSATEGVGKETRIYKQRFTPQEENARESTWKILCKSFFNPYIKETDRVLDLGAGDGLFIRNITARKRIAVDLSPHVRELDKLGIETILAPATEFNSHLREPVDVIFMSNFLEHLPDKRVLLRVLEECHRALSPGGRLLILQPNIRYVGAAYWDYIDHHIALTEHSLVEALEVSDFRVERLIPRFLPYTARSRIGRLAGGGQASGLISLYLRLPWLWRFLGQQTFVAARKI